MDPKGLVTGVAVGPATIVASTTVPGATIADSAAVTINITCTAELRAVVSPVNPVLSVGGKFTPTLALTTCGGLVTIQTVVTWAAVDPSVLSVNPTTGETTALKVGTTLVRATGSVPYNVSLSSIQVTVQ